MFRLVLVTLFSCARCPVFRRICMLSVTVFQYQHHQYNSGKAWRKYSVLLIFFLYIDVHCNVLISVLPQLATMSDDLQWWWCQLGGPCVVFACLQNVECTFIYLFMLSYLVHHHLLFYHLKICTWSLFQIFNGSFILSFIYSTATDSFTTNPAHCCRSKT